MTIRSSVKTGFRLSMVSSLKPEKIWRKLSAKSLPTGMIDQLTGIWSLKSNACHTVHSGWDGKYPLQVVAKDAQACETLVTSAHKYLTIEGGIQWKRLKENKIYDLKTIRVKDNDLQDTTKADLKCSDSSTVETDQNSKEQVIEVNRISVIYGLESKGDENLAKLVRKMVINWNDKTVHGNFITKVERMPNCTLADGKFPLLVAARDAQASEALVTTAQKYLTISDVSNGSASVTVRHRSDHSLEHHFVDTSQKKINIEKDSLNNSSDERPIEPLVEYLFR